VSNINYLNIDENFPIAGQDNDTQVFRDNFDSIKQALRIAKEEIGVLEDTALLLGEDNDLEGGIIRNAVLQTNLDKKYEVKYSEDDNAIFNYEEGILEFNFNNGPYQIYTIGEDTINYVTFINFPGGEGVREDVVNGTGKIIVELYSDVDEDDRVISFDSPNDPEIQYKKNNFSSPLVINSAVDPVFLEIWQHNNVVYINYLGKFVSTPTTDNALVVPQLDADAIGDLENENDITPGTLTPGMLVYKTTGDKGLYVCLEVEESLRFKKIVTEE